MKIWYFTNGLQGYIAKGFRYPVVTDSFGRCIPALSHYVVSHIANNNWRTPSSAGTKVERIVDFMAYCEDNGIPFQTLTVDTITNFRVFKLTVGIDNKPCKPHVVNQTVDELKRYWVWGCENGYYEESSLVPVSDYKTDTRGTPAFNTFNLPTAESLAKFCSYLRTPEERIALGLGYGSGMRRAEIVGLAADSVRPIGQMERVNTGAVRLPLDGYLSPTKGQKARVVEVPALLYTTMYNYLISDRATRVSKQQGQNRPRTLLVSKYGKAFQPKWLNEVCSYASAMSGTKIWPHLTRHWYATRFIEYEQHGRFKGSERKTYTYLQNLLGHAQYETTLLYAHVSTDVSSESTHDLMKYQDKLNSIISQTIYPYYETPSY